MNLNHNIAISFILLICISATPVYPKNIDTSNENIRLGKSSLMDELINDHGFDEQYIRAIFKDIKFMPELIDAISRPAEKTKTWDEYRGIFLTPKRIAAGVVFANQHKDLINRVEKETGVPAKILLGILGVETSFGNIQGRYKVINSLYTLAVGYPPRSRFFREELINLFYLCREQDLSITEIKGSYAGAMGAPQFIASSYRAYAVDGDGDGKINLFESWEDILMSIGNYLKENGWEESKNIINRIQIDNKQMEELASKTVTPKSTVADLTAAGIQLNPSLELTEKAQVIYLEGLNSDEEAVIGLHNFYVITTYNRNVMYALAVLELGESIEGLVTIDAFLFN
ncbi:MAG: lytic murein transglycosylase B [Gammaproteobacteria bacterium]|nr:lytic murein transglycosylase B [Gammaproteobacteria bacterium]